MTHLHPHRSDQDQIFQKYLDRAISEINDLAGEIARCELCEHDASAQPVVGTGHPLADIFLVKYRPSRAEAAEGVAFHGRAGEAVLASMRRLNVDPLDLYGTNCVKCSSERADCVSEHAPEWLRREITIVEPKLLVVMGEPTLDVINDLALADTEHLSATYGALQQWTHTCSALLCPDIDDSLDAPASKEAFWLAFRSLGDWYAARPPW